MKKYYAITIVLFLFTNPASSGHIEIEHEFHDVQVNSTFTINDLILSTYSDNLWTVTYKLTNNNAFHYYFYVHVIILFYKNDVLIASKTAYIDYNTCEDTGMIPNSFAFAESVMEKVDFDSVDFKVNYSEYDKDDIVELNTNALTLEQSSFHEFYTLFEWIGTIKNQSGTNILYPTIFCAFYRNNKIICIDYTYADVTNNTIAPNETASFSSYIEMPVLYDSVKYYTHYSIDLTGKVVPVELTSFTAKKENNCILLEWQTRTESNNYGFDILRNNQQIAFIKGNGTDTQTNNYTYKDEINPGTIEYKLNQIDYDGTTTEYGPVVVTNDYKLTNIKNFPNPFNAQTVIEYNLEKQQHVTIDIYNINGQLIETIIDKQQEPGTHRTIWNAVNQPSGIYFYALKTDTKTLTGKMILVK